MKPHIARILEASDGLYLLPESGKDTSMKIKFIKRKVYEMNKDELLVVQNALVVAAAAARADIKALEGHSAEVLEPQIVRAAEYEKLLRKIFRRGR